MASDLLQHIQDVHKLHRDALTFEYCKRGPAFGSGERANGCMLHKRQCFDILKKFLVNKIENEAVSLHCLKKFSLHRNQQLLNRNSQEARLEFCCKESAYEEPRCLI